MERGAVVLSTIAKRQYFDDFLKEHPQIIEVYSDTGFKLDNRAAQFCLLVKGTISYSVVLEAFQYAFKDPIRLYISHTPMHYSLADKRIIWKEGRWYL